MKYRLILEMERAELAEESGISEPDVERDAPYVLGIIRDFGQVVSIEEVAE